MNGTTSRELRTWCCKGSRVCQWACTAATPLRHRSWPEAILTLCSYTHNCIVLCSPTYHETQKHCTNKKWLAKVNEQLKFYMGDYTLVALMEANGYYPDMQDLALKSYNSGWEWENQVWWLAEVTSCWPGVVRVNGYMLLLVVKTL